MKRQSRKTDDKTTIRAQLNTLEWVDFSMFEQPQSGGYEVRDTQLKIVHFVERCKHVLLNFAVSPWTKLSWECIIWFALWEPCMSRVKEVFKILQPTDTAFASWVICSRWPRLCVLAIPAGLLFHLWAYLFGMPETWLKIARIMQLRKMNRKSIFSKRFSAWIFHT